MQLVIRVNLGNDAMQSAYDAGQAIWKSLGSYTSDPLEILDAIDCGTIRDNLGNAVGSWEVEDGSPA